MPPRDPLHDAGRLGELRALAILDTPPEEDFDDLAAMTAVVTGSRVAAINFVDDERHFTKAIVGAPERLGSSLANDVSFCAATVNEDAGMLVVEDLQADPRWSSHPLVQGDPHLRFYMGAAIVSRGKRVGVVCAFGPEPREVTEEERKGLLVLAHQAAAQLRHRARRSS